MTFEPIHVPAWFQILTFFIVLTLVVHLITSISDYFGRSKR